MILKLHGIDYLLRWSRTKTSSFSYGKFKFRRGKTSDSKRFRLGIKTSTANHWNLILSLAAMVENQYLVLQ